MSYSLKNDEIYDKTIDFIFSLDKNSNILNIKMIKALFDLYGIKDDKNKPITMKYFEKYYNTTNFTKSVLKNKDQSEIYDETYIKNGLKSYSDNNNKLDINVLYEDLKKLNPNIDLNNFKNYININVFKNSNHSMDTFYNYILNLLKE